MDTSLIEASAKYQALKGGTLPSRLGQQSFSLLRKLAGNTGQLPDRYLARGVVADELGSKSTPTERRLVRVRRGTLFKKAVVVTTIHIWQNMDFHKIRKVGTATFSLY